MLGWMIAFLGGGIVIGSMVMSSCLNDYVKEGIMQRRGRIYRIIDITDKLQEVNDDHA
ncbi:hypothetical protein [Enterobacter cloacae]|uniref:hypothetical protein n=1 Tax=Enterobacter cloacae TaxID=550 RepID=UPI001F123323|nr:hypothetical protein [Enterobacter cloacae]